DRGLLLDPSASGPGEGEKVVVAVEAALDPLLAIDLQVAAALRPGDLAGQVIEEPGPFADRPEAVHVDTMELRRDDGDELEGPGRERLRRQRPPRPEARLDQRQAHQPADRVVDRPLLRRQLEADDLVPEDRPAEEPEVAATAAQVEDARRRPPVEPELDPDAGDADQMPGEIEIAEPAPPLGRVASAGLVQAVEAFQVEL